MTDWLLIEKAAQGEMTGELGEWPFLRRALLDQGHPLPPDTPAEKVIALCRQLIDEEARA